jgi:hypothetical protein
MKLIKARPLHVLLLHLSHQIDEKYLKAAGEGVGMVPVAFM